MEDVDTDNDAFLTQDIFIPETFPDQHLEWTGLGGLTEEEKVQEVTRVLLETRKELLNIRQQDVILFKQYRQLSDALKSFQQDQIFEKNLRRYNSLPTNYRPMSQYKERCYSSSIVPPRTTLVPPSEYGKPKKPRSNSTSSMNREKRISEYSDEEMIEVEIHHLDSESVSEVTECTRL